MIIISSNSNSNSNGNGNGNSNSNWLRTNDVNTNGAAAKVMNFDRLGKKHALALLGRQR